MENEHVIKIIYSNLKCAEDWDREELINYALTYLKDNIDAINYLEKEDEGEIHINEALEALKEASISVACALDEPKDVTEKDLKHIQDKITVLENFLDPIY